MNEEKLKLLHEHYKDTFAHTQTALRQRDRLFLYLLMIITIMLVQHVAPTETVGALNEVIKEKLGLTKAVDITVIGSVVWFLVLGISIRYFQAVVYIERMYDYLHALEDQIAAEFTSPAFTREGKFYSTDYPWFSRWVGTLYTIILPALFVIVVGVKIYGEWGQPTWSAPLVFNCVCSVAVFLSTGLYLALVHANK